jgi:DnaD/phage-associated family protein
MANSNQYSISAGVNTSYYYQWENFANYNRRFGKHDVTAMIGMSYIENNSDSASISSQGEDILSSYEPQYRYINYLKDDAVKTVSNAPGKSASLSYFGRLGYSYDNRYSVQANFRADAFDSSKLPASNRWGYFPSVSAGWTMSNESFIKDNVDKSVLSFLKLRGSWGRNGNVNILSGYPYTATISLNGQWYQYNPSTGTGNLTYGSGPTDMPNDKLKWETSEQLDFGIDARLFSDRLSVTVDWYKKLTKDLLVSFAPVPEIGVKSTYANAGNVLNTGFEFELGWKDSVGDFNYGINANFSTLHNEVLSLHSALDRISGGGISGLNNKIRSAFEAGYPIWYFRGYKYAGVNTETGAPQYYDRDGNIRESPQDGDMQYIGKAIPDATYGLTLNLGYKGFDLVVFGTGTVGNDIACLLYSADRSRTNSLTHFWNNSWKNPGDNTLYPKSATVAIDWADKGITTYESAEEHIRELEMKLSNEGKVRAILGIYDRALTQTEKKYINIWISDKNIPLPLITEAYDRTVSQTGKLSYAYMNKILMSWCEEGIESPEQLKERDTLHMLRNGADRVRSNVKESKFNNYTDTNKPDYTTFADQILQDMLDEG